ncbi:hypothetical protein OTU49_001792 [Cherax quadricarinatus]|uniref:Paramyosin n=1 Tax=Cherax quadricarinatus TaxID=27406 RepID=A0AAW0YSG3_CHEQU
MWGRFFRAAMVLAVVVVVVSPSGGALPLEEDQELERHRGSAQRRVTRQQPIYGITHLDIRDAILTLEKSIKDVTSKLNRHEAREAQVADFSTKTLTGLLSGHTVSDKHLQTIARQLANMEERLISTEALVQTTDERQRVMMSQIAQGLDRMLASGPALEEFPGGDAAADENSVIKNLKKLTRKVNGVDTLLQQEMRKISNEVKIVGETVGQHMEQLQQRHDRLSSSMDTCQSQTVASIQHLGASLAATADRIQEQMEQRERDQEPKCSEGSNVTTRLDVLNQHYRRQEEELHKLSEQTQKGLNDHLNTLKMLLEDSHAGQARINASVADLAQNLRNLNRTTQEGLGRFSSDVTTAVRDTAATVAETVSTLSNELKEGTSNIIDILDDRASQAENLQQTVLENYSDLSAEISSLKRVEQVMINTADSVLDTKRSIEFGIQQIILELGEIVKNSGSNINSTLSDQISNISFAILKNQTSALTNMTAKMEQEISQVWRQIGIMYQQMTQSVDLLDQLKDTTKQHMNASLSRVGNMDGTVDKISTKVDDVENNLNYLLGRLSLVVSEFNLMKYGVGEELMRLRENLAKENNNNNVHFAGEQPSPDSRYEVNRKRHAPVHTESYPGHNPEPLTVF